MSSITRFERSSATKDSWLVKTIVLSLSLSFFGIFLLLPLISVFTEALRKGLLFYIQAISEPDTWSAIKLTLLAAGIAVPLNLIFGVAASWAIAFLAATPSIWFSVKGRAATRSSRLPRCRSF